MSMTRTYRSGSQVAVFPIARQSIRLSRVYGYFNSNNNSNTKVWLQFFTTTVNTDGTVAAPTAGQVPLESFLMIPDYEFAEFFNSGLTLVPGPTYCALSTTEATYTAVASGQVADIYIEAEEWEQEPPTLTTVGPTTSNIFTIWVDTLAAPSAAKALYDVVVTDLNQNSGAQLYLLMYNESFNLNPTPLENRVWAIPLPGTAGNNINVNATLLLNFGDSTRGGLTPFSQGGVIGSLNTGTNYSACYLRASLTPNAYTAPAASSVKITARYCTPTV